MRASSSPEENEQSALLPVNIQVTDRAKPDPEEEVPPRWPRDDALTTLARRRLVGFHGKERRL